MLAFNVRVSQTVSFYLRLIQIFVRIHRFAGRMNWPVFQIVWFRVSKLSSGHGYMDRMQKEVDLVKYVLSNARCLKTATILFRSSDSALEEDELEMVLQDLSLSSRGSKDVKLVFV